MRAMSLFLVLCIATQVNPFYFHEHGKDDSLPIHIAGENRVANDEHVGVCWWACADMIGREFGILPLIDIKNRVLNTSVGRDRGARHSDIAFWLKALRLKARYRPAGKKDGLALCKWLAEGLPVIASMDHWVEANESHAILLLHVTRCRVAQHDVSGHVSQDFIVTYIDPNRPEFTRKITWRRFLSYWNGRIYAFDPKEQRRRLLRDKPECLLLVLTPGLANQSAGTVTAALSQYAVQTPPVDPHRLPYVVNSMPADHFICTCKRTPFPKTKESGTLLSCT